MKEQPAEIYLFFDFDFTKESNRIDCKARLEHFNILSKMLKIFSNPTENGLLFINYPQSESFEDINDYKLFLSSTHRIINDDGEKIEYKGINRMKDYWEKDKDFIHDKMVVPHLIKANIICNEKESKPEKYDDIEQMIILSKQLHEIFKNEMHCYILNGFPLFLFWFFGLKLSK